MDIRPMMSDVFYQTLENKVTKKPEVKQEEAKPVVKVKKVKVEPGDKKEASVTNNKMIKMADGECPKGYTRPFLSPGALGGGGPECVPDDSPKQDNDGGPSWLAKLEHWRSIGDVEAAIDNISKGIVPTPQQVSSWEDVRKNIYPTLANMSAYIKAKNLALYNKMYVGKANKKA